MALHRYTLDIEYFGGNNGLTVTVYRNGDQVSETSGKKVLSTLQTAMENIAEIEDEEMHEVSE